ncbi:hypothetical protein COLO4_37548 [Corchorus olitorius]|uniref:Uncharacterized protein n=1 Tax=Corchorus olitorius TaxID=93759 RepID=A0A1R3G0T7_9ROSI|nr:hypothetical protein COLO4_37548 [Corchorus olitorius]
MIVNTRGEEGREFIMNKSEEDYVEYVVYDSINGKLELEPNVDPPVASPKLIEEELDPTSTGEGGGAFADPPDYLPMDEKARLKVAVKAQMVEKNKTKAPRKRSADQSLPSDLPPKKPKSVVLAQQATPLATPQALRLTSASKPSARVGGSGTGGTSKGTPCHSGDQELSGKEGVHSKKAAVPPKEKSKGNLDFLCTLMARSLKLGKPKEVDIIQSISDDECAVSIVACTHQVNCCGSPLLPFVL